MWGSESLAFPQRKAVLARHNYTKIRIKPCSDLLPFCFLPRTSPSSPLIVLSTSSFPACYPFVGALGVSSFVYTCVYSCVPTCTLLYTRVYTEAIITTSFRGSLLLYGWASLCVVDGSPLLYGWALVYSTNGLLFTLRMGSPRLARRARTSTMDSLFSSPWRAPLVIVTDPL